MADEENEEVTEVVVEVTVEEKDAALWELRERKPLICCSEASALPSKGYIKEQAPESTKGMFFFVLYNSRNQAIYYLHIGQHI